MICYLGDTSLDAAAGYLGGVMQHAGFSYDYTASDSSLPERFRRQSYDLYILSDYPYVRWNDTEVRHLQDRVRDGAGLLMIGGWESFHGLGGDYEDTPFAEMLPVIMQREDDRQNCPQPVFLRPTASQWKKFRDGSAHPILDGLPWETPSAIGGFNLFSPKPDAEVLLEGVAAGVRLLEDGSLTLQPGTTYPMLVLGRYGRGTTAALAFDAAPHWVGQLVDWGTARITQPVHRPDTKEICNTVEIGDAYVRFLCQLISAVRGT